MSHLTLRLVAGLLAVLVLDASLGFEAWQDRFRDRLSRAAYPTQEGCSAEPDIEHCA